MYLQPIGSSESRRPFTASYSPSSIVSGRTLVQSPTSRIGPSRIPLAWQVQRISHRPLTFGDYDHITYRRNKQPLYVRLVYAVRMMPTVSVLLLSLENYFR